MTKSAREINMEIPRLLYIDHRDLALYVLKDLDESKMNHKEINFLEGIGTDDYGRRLIDVFTWDDRRLETTHSYIQRCFPLDEPSKSDDSAPILSHDDVIYLIYNDLAKTNISSMYRRMLRFYKLDDENYKDLKIQRHWNHCHDHNHLRITRMLKCFLLIGMREEWQDLSVRLRYLITNNGLRVSAKTREIWDSILYTPFYEKNNSKNTPNGIIFGTAGSGKGFYVFPTTIPCNLPNEIVEPTFDELKTHIEKYQIQNINLGMVKVEDNICKNIIIRKDGTVIK